MKNDKDENSVKKQYEGKTYAYVAIASAVASAVSLGLIFTVLGIYALIAAVLFGISSLSFVKIQKRKNAFKRLIIIETAAYLVLAVAAAAFIGGIVWSAVN